MSTPRNTEKEASENPVLALFQGLVMGSSGSILAQEAQGQQEFVESTVLPTNGIKEVEQLFRIIGGTVGEKVADDPLFTEVSLPLGWSKKASDHSMWSYVVDANGNNRIAVFYKAAFYDRNAHCYLEKRFSVLTNYSSDQQSDTCYIADAQGVVSFELKHPLKPEGEKEMDAYWSGRDAIEAKVKAHLEAAYPDWKNPMAYWGGDLVS